MDEAIRSRTIEFDHFRLDLRGRSLFRRADDGSFQPILLGGRAFDLLHLLTDHAGQLVSKSEIMDAVWPGLAVEDSNVTVQIAALRKVLDDGRVGPSCIQTVPSRGYRFVLIVRDEGRPSVPPVMPDAPAIAAMRGRAARRLQVGHRRLLVAGAAALLVLAGLLIETFTFRQAALEAPRLSIAVLPFENLGGGSAQDYVADSITDDLSTDLSHIPGAFVIARSSAYTYRSQRPDPRQVGRALGVRYMLAGSVRGMGETLRVNAWLISTETGATLWTDRLDKPIGERAVGQDEIVRHIGAALGITVVELEVARALREHPGTPDAFDLVLRARSLRNRARTGNSNNAALTLYEQALRRDPTSVPAMLGIAGILIDRNLGTLGQWSTIEEVVRAATLIVAANAAQPDSEEVLVRVAELAQAEERWSDLAVVAQRLIERFPNRVEGYELLGMAKRFVGSPEEAVALYETSIRLNPLESNLFFRCSCMGYALLLIGRYDDSIAWFERSLAVNPDASPGSRGGRYRSIAAAHALQGRLTQAQEAMRRANELSPYATARIFFPDNPHDPAQVRQMLRLQEGLRLAGLPDHADEEGTIGAAPEGKLRRDLTGPTPAMAPGARTIRTSELPALLEAEHPLVLDTGLYSWGHSLPDAVGLANSGLGGTIDDAAQERLRRTIRELTQGETGRPILVVGFNALRFDGYNLAVRLVALGYSNVYWYRGGREAWEVARMPEAEMMMLAW
jgi:adenylate cyclase